MDSNSDPWAVEIITPSTSLISKFENYDKTKSNASKRRSFNRARKWISDLLKREFKIAENEKLRHIDIVLALEDMTNALAMPGGVTYEDYLRSCLAPLPIHSDQVQNSSILAKPKEVSDVDLGLNEDEDFLDAEDKFSPSENEDKSYQCDACDSSFAEMVDLNSHLNDVHKGKKSFKCNICGSEFADYKGLKRHKEAAHEEKKTLKCNICDLNLLSQPELDIHMATVHGPSTSVTNPNTENSEPVAKVSSLARISPEKKICKSIWLNETCQTTDCDRAHPPRCKNPDCLIIDQGLPKWKILQCRNWHSLPKKKKFFKPQLRFNSKAYRTQPSVSGETQCTHQIVNILGPRYLSGKNSHHRKIAVSNLVLQTIHANLENGIASLRIIFWETSQPPG